jgi:hypothetical protein
VMRRKCKTGELEDGRWKGNMVNGWGLQRKGEAKETRWRRIGERNGNNQIGSQPGIFLYRFLIPGRFFRWFCKGLWTSSLNFFAFKFPPPDSILQISLHLYWCFPLFICAYHTSPHGFFAINLFPFISSPFFSHLFFASLID